MTTDYDKMSDEQVVAKIAEVMGEVDPMRGVIADGITCGLRKWNPLASASDRDDVEWWAGKDDLDFQIMIDRTHSVIRVDCWSRTQNELFSSVVSHDDTRPSIDRAKGRAVCIAVLKALEAKKGGG